MRGKRVNLENRILEVERLVRGIDMLAPVLYKPVGWSWLVVGMNMVLAPLVHAVAVVVVVVVVAREGMVSLVAQGVCGDQDPCTIDELLLCLKKRQRRQRQLLSEKGSRGARGHGLGLYRYRVHCPEWRPWIPSRRRWFFAG